MTGDQANGRRSHRTDDSSPLPRTAAAALDLLAGESPTSRTFLGGLVLGALVGAALAGATAIRNRASGRRRSDG